MKFELRHAVFPILPLYPEVGRPPRVYCEPSEQGSAFFLSKDGLFLTARHVVNKWSADSHAVVAFNFRDRTKKDCRVLELERHPDIDIALGRAEKPALDGWPHPFTIGESRIGNRSALIVYGYANTKATPRRDPDGPINLDDKLTLEFAPRVYRGHVVEYLERAPGINAPCYHISCDPGGGISGGPLIRKMTNVVHGIFNAGIPASEPGGPATGFAVDLKAILSTWRISFLGGLTLREYAERYPGCLSVR